MRTCSTGGSTRSVRSSSRTPAVSVRRACTGSERKWSRRDRALARRGRAPPRLVLTETRRQGERMRPVHKELAEPVGRGLLGAASVDGGPTDEQLGIIGALLHGYFGVDTDVASLEPLDPAALA